MSAIAVFFLGGAGVLGADVRAEANVRYSGQSSRQTHAVGYDLCEEEQVPL